MLPAPASRPQPRIGRYRVIGRIGRGGMGMVYRGVDEALEREVAIKTLTVEGTLDEESRRRFEVEAKAAAKLQHPNIVTVFELGEDRGVPYIAMELLPGTDLEALVRAGEPLLLREKLETVIQVCRGLAFAHEHGIVHRDIKPSNIRILDDGTAKIMDFGIAKLTGTNLTKTGMMVGTVHYMSPEQIRGKPLDGRSDVFSVGVILYELLCGQRPFRGEGATEILYKIVHEEPPPIVPEVMGDGAQIREVVNRALAKDPDHRYASATALAEDLAKVLGSEPRAAAASLPPEVTETLNQSRRLVQEGRVEDGLARLSQIAETYADSAEVRRALRGARREQQRRKAPADVGTNAFPELEATFQAPPTQQAAEGGSDPTVLQSREDPIRPTVVLPAPASGPRLGMLAGGAVVLLAVGVGGFLLLRGEKAVAPPAAGVRVPVRSRPSGAAVLLDGKATGVLTDGELVLNPPLAAEATLTFRKAGLREVTRTVKLPLAAGEAVSVTLEGGPAVVPVTSEPAGATVNVDGKPAKGATPLELTLDGATEHRITVSLAGHASKDVVVAAGGAPAELRVKLEPTGPVGSVIVASAYPVDVVWKGRVLAKDQTEARVSIPSGRQGVTLVSTTYFLHTEVGVSVPPGGEVRLDAPGLGKLSIRAIPDNCQISIEGTFVDYPPILDKPVAAGTRTVSFKWPDGAKSQELVEVPRGGTAFVTGRKE